MEGGYEGLRLGWMDGVKVAFGNRGMMVEAARKIGKSVEPWYVCNRMSLTWPFLLGTVYFWTALPCSGGHHFGGVGCRYMMRLG